MAAMDPEEQEKHGRNGALMDRHASLCTWSMSLSPITIQAINRTGARRQTSKRGVSQPSGRGRGCMHAEPKNASCAKCVELPV
jgi:hypothetical protein